MVQRNILLPFGIKQLVIQESCMIAKLKQRFTTITIKALLSTWIWLPFTLITLPWLYLTIHDSSSLFHGSISLYLTLFFTLPWLYFTLLDSTLIYYGCPETLHLTLLLLPWLYHGCSSVLTLAHSTWLTMVPLNCTSLYFTIPRINLTLRLPFLSTMTLLHSKWLYMTLQWDYFNLLHCSTLHYYGATSHLNYHYSTMVLHHFTWVDSSKGRVK